MAVGNSSGMTTADMISVETAALRWLSAVGLIVIRAGSHYIVSSLRGWEGVGLVNRFGGGRTAWQPPAAQQVIDVLDERFLGE